MSKSQIFIVDGLQVLNTQIADFNHDLREYQYKCQYIRDSYTFKTSTVTTSSGNVKQYGNWYMKHEDGRLTSVGKDEPNYEEEFPTKPLKPVTPPYEQADGGHIIIPADRFKPFKKDFKKCFCFPLETRVK